MRTITISKHALLRWIRITIYYVLHSGNHFFRSQVGSHIIVLSYHSISKNAWKYGVTFTEFQKQIEFLSQHYQFITIDDLYAFLTGENNISKPSVLLTFDDGYEDILITKSFLERNHIKPALFVLSKRDLANRAELNNSFTLLNKTEILSLYKTGWIIGSHTATHADLTKITLEQLKKEITESKKSLEDELGISVDYLAYPKGFYTKQAVKLAQESGYKMALSVDDEIITKNTNKYIIPRITIDRTHSSKEFQYMISPAGILLRQFLKKTGLGKLMG